MLRSVAGKVMWLGRATIFLIGLAVILGLLFGVATTALGASGGNFILGRANAATTVSSLTASVAGPALQLVNRSTDAAATALNISVASGKAPLKVNAAAGTATNLSADRLDGQDSAVFQRRVSGQCPAGESIRAVGADGTTVVCEPDDQGDGGAAQVDALKSELATNYGAPNESSDPVSFSKIKDTPADVMDRDAATLDDRDSTSFADASHQHSGADVTSGTVEADRIEDGADSGLDADAIDGLDSTALQRRVSGTCDPGSAVRAISNDGTVTCEADDTGASEINADDMAPLPAVRARSSNLSVENTTHTPLALTFEDVDQVGAGQTFFSEMHASTTNRFTAPRAGIYEVQAEVIWAGSSAGTTGTGERQIILRKNFTTCGAGSFDGMDVQYADPVEQITNHVSMLMTMNPGDSVILCGYQNSGESLNAVFVFANMHYVSGK